jgi:hypothetical protein
MLDYLEITHIAELCFFRFKFDGLNCEERTILKKKILHCVTFFDEVKDIGMTPDYIWVKIAPDVDRQSFINDLKKQLNQRLTNLYLFPPRAIALKVKYRETVGNTTPWRAKNPCLDYCS